MFKSLLVFVGTVLLVGACGDDSVSAVAQRITCTAGSGSTICSCNTSSSSPSSVSSCKTASTDDVCCAESGWPSSGTCSCKKPDEIRCGARGSESCTCGVFPYTTTGSASDSCYPTGTTSPSDGTSSTGVCCKSEMTCTCDASRTACSSGTEVDKCSAAEFPAACASGQQRTPSCSNDTSASAGPSSTAFTITGTFETDSKSGSNIVKQKMSLTQSGNNVTGEYIPSVDPWGTLTGTLSGNKLTGRWAQGSAGGPIEFVFSADGSSFTGWWDRHNTNDHYFWNGTRTSTTPEKLEPRGGGGGGSRGCTGNSDCARCQRCVLSTGSCVAKLVCN